MNFSPMCGAIRHMRHFYFQKGEQNARGLSGTKYLLFGVWDRHPSGVTAGHGPANG
jgi:hypothetical protein